MKLTIGSLCSGYGGLEMGVEMALGPVRTTWHAEVDPDAAAVLAGNWPDVPNLGDITAVDWDRVEPVDILCAGYPCQGESNAGLRRGTDDPRWRWPDVARAVRHLRPRLVVLENVRGHLRRGFGTAVADLAALGYVGSWACVRACDVGAPHRRERVVIVAHPAADAPGFGRAERWAEPTGPAGGPGAALGGAEAAGDAPALSLLPTPAARAGRRGAGWGDQPGRPLSETVMRIADRWGDYAPTIARWETVLGRPAPEPTEPGRLGAPRLSPRFVEWLMGLPEGHVTKHVPEIDPKGVRRPTRVRSASLRILGNGAVPQQMAHAVRGLLAVTR